MKTKAFVQRQQSFSATERIYHPVYRNGSPTYYVRNVLDAFRFRGTILQNTWPLILFVCLEACAVVVLHDYFEYPIHMDDRLITMLGSGMALLLAFRTNRGFERYNSGAQVWINLGSQLRNAAHHIWCFPTQTQEAHDEKLSILKLLYAVAIATKYSLRGHDPLHFDEVQSLLPKPDSHHDSATASNSTLAFKPLTPVIASAEMLRGVLTKRPASLAASMEGLESEAKRIPRKPTRPSTATIGGLRRGSVINAPLDMLYKAASYVKRLKRSGAIEQDDSGPAVVALNAAIDSVTKFEQLLYVPVPKSYDVHIKQILILYFLSLPFQLVRQHGWATVFVSFVGSLTFFGTDAIAGEISDPFGSDQHDLPLDYFCKKLREDLEVVMGRPFQFEDTIIFTNELDHKIE